MHDPGFTLHASGVATSAARLAARPGEEGAAEVAAAVAAEEEEAATEGAAGRLRGHRAVASFHVAWVGMCSQSRGERCD